MGEMEAECHTKPHATYESLEQRLFNPPQGPAEKDTSGVFVDHAAGARGPRVTAAEISQPQNAIGRSTAAFPMIPQNHMSGGGCILQAGQSAPVHRSVEVAPLSGWMSGCDSSLTAKRASTSMAVEGVTALEDSQQFQRPAFEFTDRDGSRQTGTLLPISPETKPPKGEDLQASPYKSPYKAAGANIQSMQIGFDR